MFLTFDDVLIEPQFSDITSRKEVDLSTDKFHYPMKLPVFSANMDTITGTDMCRAMDDCGGLGVLHRFMSIDDNYDQFNSTGLAEAAVSVGLGIEEINRARHLLELDAKLFFLDVAHGAQLQVVQQYDKLKELGCEFIVVGNFATPDSIMEFCRRLGYEPDAVKVGIGPGSVCTTRLKTGVGLPQLSAIINCSSRLYNMTDIPIIADGGIRTPGDIAKALAAGASAVMLGGMLAGTDETPGEVMLTTEGPRIQYRGSASKESYNDQGKNSGWRTAEGEAITVPCKGPVSNILKDIEGGLRSAFTYVGAKNVREFQEKAKFVKITQTTQKENSAHGKG